MSEERDKPDSDNEASETPALRGGERLAAARREQSITVLEVAKELHLDEAKVRALERNEFDVLGAPVFAKGHLRKYAQLVGVDPDDVFTDYYQMTRAEGVPPVVSATRSRTRHEVAPGPWVAVIVVIIVAAATYWWFVVQSESQLAPVPVGEQAPLQEQAVESSPAIETEPAGEQPAVTTEAATPDEPIAVVSEPQPDSVPPAAGETRVSLTFSGDCWTELSDATGRRLFFDMGRNGRTVEVTGRAPFAALFGNAENVSVRVNGVDYPVSPSNPGSRTARLTIVDRRSP